ncbi:solute:sodium symporter family transporter [Flavilitoribacter nigricans]|uniref:Solute:sodium symporter family transporter n=1 Tax=Flavilitoribacter nigricans (strain ATCC 23147 / DSM 23189 / NBRC 102662 / NCIMB 1420 / SS-2) TaxID=1122177 RepID=A0A2D0NEN6_FLAN2|nr:solute:sodium symporter family transporter [Flavilitoribacter nigricans]PHN06243.1 solute:sodium symporter family transporter [Flavilitoribacter nigricans DSM 23189 = NBRC 102662]
MVQFLVFIAFTAFVAYYASRQLRKDDLRSKDGYFLGGRSLTGVVIAGSMLLTNISTEHLIGMNGSAYKNGAIIIAWEVTSAIALVIAALYFIPRYLKMGLTTIPEFLEKRFDGLTRTLINLLLIVSIISTLLPIVLYTGAINIESIFGISELLGISQGEGLWLTVVVVGCIGAVYAIFGGLKMVAHTDTINGFGLLIAGLLVPILALWDIGDGNLLNGLSKVYQHAPEKFNVVSRETSVGPGSRDAILPFSVLFTGLVINQLYFWAMHQSIIQRALGAVSLKEAQKGLLFTGLFKILMPIVIVLPGIIGFYYFGDQLYGDQDTVYPELLKKVLPLWMTGFFVAVIMGAILSTFNSALNSAATLFSVGIYKRYINRAATDNRLVNIGKLTSAILAIGAIAIAPFVANAPDGLYQLLQQLNGIFFIPMATVIIAGFLFPRVSAIGAKAGLIFGLLFYILVYMVFAIDLHFVHVWGIEFILNIIVMHAVSIAYPPKKTFSIQDVGVVEMTQWKYAKPMGIALTVVTILIYILLGNV